MMSGMGGPMTMQDSQTGNNLKNEDKAWLDAFKDVSNLMQWESSRNQCNQEFDEAVQHMAIGDFRNALILLTAVATKYTTYAKFLDEQELANRNKLTELLTDAERGVQKLDNIQHHNYVLTNIGLLKIKVINYQLFEAHKLLYAMYQEALLITNPEDVTGFIQLTVFEESLTQLSAFIKQVNDRMQQQSSGIAKAITDNLMQQKLPADDYEFLNNTIADLLKSLWSVLDRRNLDEVSAKISAAIKINLQKNNYLVAYCTSTNFYIGSQEQTKHSIEHAIIENLPHDFREPLQLEIFKQLSPRAQQSRPLMFLP